MSIFSKKIISVFVLLSVVGLALFVMKSSKKDEVVFESVEVIEASAVSPQVFKMGSSFEGREISAYKYGSGEKNLLFVGGIHGGYEWNSVMLAYTLMDYLDENPDTIPDDITVNVIPVLNPDGLFKVTGKEGRFSLEDVSKDSKVLASGRFNGNNVDLNRNFDCKWKPEAVWRSQTVSAGLEPFSEPESKALKDFVLKIKPLSVVFWHSQSNAIYASECEDGVSDETKAVVDKYAKASGYKSGETFNSYEVVGDSDGWLASINIPSFSVELKTHEVIEWEKNLAGVKALLEYHKGK